MWVCTIAWKKKSNICSKNLSSSCECKTITAIFNKVRHLKEHLSEVMNECCQTAVRPTIQSTPITKWNKQNFISTHIALWNDSAARDRYLRLRVSGCVLLHRTLIQLPVSLFPSYRCSSHAHSFLQFLSIHQSNSRTLSPLTLALRAPCCLMSLPKPFHQIEYARNNMKRQHERDWKKEREREIYLFFSFLHIRTFSACLMGIWVSVSSRIWRIASGLGGAHPREPTLSF